MACSSCWDTGLDLARRDFETFTLTYRVISTYAETTWSFLYYFRRRSHCTNLFEFSLIVAYLHSSNAIAGAIYYDLITRFLFHNLLDLAIRG